jgi:hypothetical protein
VIQSGYWHGKSKIPFIEEAANLSPSPDHRTNQSTLTWTSNLPHLIQLESGKEAT